MELEINMKSSWADSKPTYKVEEDNSDPDAFVRLTPTAGNTIYLDHNGVQDLIDVLTMLKQRM